MWQVTAWFRISGRSGFNTENHFDYIVINIDALDESANQLAPGRPVGGLQSITDHVCEEAHLADHQLQGADFLDRILQSGGFRFQPDDTPPQLRDAGLELLAGNEALRVA